MYTDYDAWIDPHSVVAVTTIPGQRLRSEIHMYGMDDTFPMDGDVESVVRKITAAKGRA